MAGGCGGAATCSCLIVGGPGIAVEGSGTQSNPFVVSADLPDFSDILRVRDTNTVNLSLFGSGTANDPFLLQADATVRLQDLADVVDPQGGPRAGEVPVWVGPTSTGHWEFQVPPPSPAGAVNVEQGLLGIGTAPDPIRLATSGVWGSGALAGLGSDSTIGLEVYIDSAGQVRARPVTSGPAVTWATLPGKPTTFTPSAHTHVAADIPAIEQAKLDVGKISGKRIYSTPGNATPPTSPAPALGDIWVYS